MPRSASWRIPAFRRRRAQQLGATARTVAQAAPETLTVVRYRAQPAALTIARLATTAIFAYLVALALPGGTARPVLAPLTALLVVQVTLYQTLRSATRRVAAVVTGVLVAIALSDLVGFTWWSLGITIVAALVLGYLLRLGDTVLEVPISAMLILSVGGTRGEAASGRIVETLVGAGAGLLAGLVLAAPRVQPAHEAITDLCRKMSGLLDRMADGLCDGSAVTSAGRWLDEARALAGEIRRVDEAVREAEESIKLSLRLPASSSPAARSAPGARTSGPGGSRRWSAACRSGCPPRAGSELTTAVAGRRQAAGQAAEARSPNLHRRSAAVHRAVTAAGLSIGHG